MTSSLIIKGDIVQLITGHAPVRVSETRTYSPLGYCDSYDTRQLRGRYVNSGIDIDWRDCNDFIRMAQPVVVAKPCKAFETFRDIPVGVPCILRSPEGRVIGTYKRDTSGYYEQYDGCKWQKYESNKAGLFSYQAIRFPEAKPIEPMPLMPLFKEIAEGVVVELETDNTWGSPSEGVYYKKCNEKVYYYFSQPGIKNKDWNLLSGSARVRAKNTRVKSIIPSEKPVVKNSWDEYISNSGAFSVKSNTALFFLKPMKSETVRKEFKKAATALNDWIDAGCPTPRNTQ